MIVTAAWVAVTGLLARSELNHVKTQLAQLRQDVSNNDLADARIVAADLARHAHRAHILTTGPAWFTVAKLPGVGAPMTAVRGGSAAADALGSGTVPKLIQVSQAVDPKQFHITNHQIDITPLIQQTPTLDAAVQAADEQRARVSALPQHTWLKQVDSGVANLNTSLSKLVGTLDSLDRAAHAAPTMLGYGSPQRYFVGFQNEAEARGSGGLPGAFGIVVADHGKVTFTHFGSDSELDGVDSGVNLGTDYNNQWRDFTPTKQYLNSTVSPNFPDAAKIWAGMWQAKSGQHIDGALSLDPTALSYFLGVSGPAKLADGSQVTTANIVALTQSTVYARFANDNAGRKAYLLEVAKAVDEHILGGGGSSSALFKAASKAAGERRLLLWHKDSAVESALSGSPIGGAIPETKAPFAGIYAINYGANKLDYYLDRSTTWTASGCGSNRDVAVKITLRNNAPNSNLPGYVTQRKDDPPYAVRPGDNRVMVYYMGTSGGSLVSATLDGQAIGVIVGRSQGHPTFSAIVEVPRSTSRRMVLHLVEPHNSQPNVVVEQPTVLSSRVAVSRPQCP
jgi:hypothetical protein